jgi:hypothetical protein
MNRRTFFLAAGLSGLPLIGKYFKPNPTHNIIRVLPYYLFPNYKPGDNIFWYEYPYWEVKLTGKVEAAKEDGDYKYLVVRVDEHSARKLTDATRYPVWAMQVQPRHPHSQTPHTPLQTR